MVAGIVDARLYLGSRKTTLPSLSKRTREDGPVVSDGLDGLLTQAAAGGSGVHAVTASAHDDLGMAILAAIRAVKTSNYVPSAIAMHGAALSHLQALRGSSTDVVLYPETRAASPSLWGLPIVESPNLPLGAADTNGLQSTSIVVAAWNTIHAGVIPSSFKVSDSASIVIGQTTEHLFQQDKVGVRAVFNIGGPVIRRPTAVAVVSADV